MPHIIGHRGSYHLYIENSLSGFKFCRNQKIDRIEFDIQWTRDDQWILFHDRTLKKDGLAKKTPQDFSYQDLKQFIKTKRSWNLITLKEFLGITYREQKLYFEIKAPQNLEINSQIFSKINKLLQCINQYSVATERYFLSFNENLLNVIKKISPLEKTILNWNSPIHTYKPSEYFAICTPATFLNLKNDPFYLTKNIKRIYYGVDNKRLLKLSVIKKAHAIITKFPTFIKKTYDQIKYGR